MKLKSTLVLTISAILYSPIGIVSAADQQQTQDQTRDLTQDQLKQQDQDQLRQQTQLKDQDAKPIFGWELMSVKEREQHRQKILSMKTEEERTAYLQEHHKLMQQRAKEKGVKLPDMPAQRGAGAGPGPGAGGGRKN